MGTSSMNGWLPEQPAPPETSDPVVFQVPIPAGQCSPGQSIAPLERLLHTATLGEWAITARTAVLSIRQSIENGSKRYKQFKDPPNHFYRTVLYVFFCCRLIIKVACVLQGLRPWQWANAMFWTLTPLVSSDAAKDSREPLLCMLVPAK